MTAVLRTIGKRSKTQEGKDLKLDDYLAYIERSGTVVAHVGHVPDVRFQGLDDEDLADVWYALSGCATRHPERFKALLDAVFDELLAR